MSDCSSKVMMTALGMLAILLIADSYLPPSKKAAVGRALGSITRALGLSVADDEIQRRNPDGSIRLNDVSQPQFNNYAQGAEGPVNEFEYAKSQKKLFPQGLADAPAFPPARPDGVVHRPQGAQALSDAYGDVFGRVIPQMPLDTRTPGTVTPGPYDDDMVTLADAYGDAYKVTTSTGPIQTPLGILPAVNGNHGIQVDSNRGSGSDFLRGPPRH